MKSAIFAVGLLAVGCFSLPIFAQQQDLQEIMDAANALGARENELLSKKDAAGIASLFTSDDDRGAMCVDSSVGEGLVTHH